MATTSALLEAAYTNVSLLADAAWAPCSMGPMGVPLTGPTLDSNANVGSAGGVRTGVAFRRANQDLWLRCVNLDRYIRENQCVSTNNNNGNYITSNTSSSSMNSGQSNGWCRYKAAGNEENAAEKRPRTVRDTIPLSRLASYGGQAAYDEEREKLYTADDCVFAASPVPPMDTKVLDEPWLMSAVEEIFKRLTAYPERPLKSQRKIEEYSGGSFQGMSRWPSAERVPELAPHLRYSSTALSRDENYPSQLQQRKSEPQLATVQRYTLTNHEEIRLQMKIRAPAIQDLWSKMNSHVRLGQSFPPLQTQKARQLNHHNHHHGQHQQMMSSTGRLSRHRSLSRFPMLQMQNLPLPQLNAEVPEFYPKTSNGPPFGLLMGTGSGCSAVIAECGGVNINTSRHNNISNAVTIFFPPANELAYQEELFPYRSEHDPVQHHKLQAMDHVAGILARPPGNGNVPMAQPTRSNNPWFLANTTNSAKPTSPALLPPGPPPAPLPPPTPPQHHKSLKATRHSTRNGKMQSIPIPVYQRPPEFYTQQNEAATNGNGTGGSIGTRRRTGGSGVDFSNLILLTRGGKGHNRASVSSAPSTTSASSRTESLASDTKSDSNRPLKAEDAPPSTGSTQASPAPQVRPPQSNQSSEDVFQWLHAAFGSTKPKNRQQVDGNQTTRTAALDVVGLPQDLAVPYSPGVSADNYVDDASAAGTRRRLYRDVLTHAACSALGEDTATTSSRPASPTPPMNSGDKFDLLEEEALMQYQSSDDNLAERTQSQSQRWLDGGTLTSTSTTGTTQSTAQSTANQRKVKDKNGSKSSAATPPPPPPVPPGDEVQSPRRRLYRDVLAHTLAENNGNGFTELSPVNYGTGNGPRDSASLSDVLQRLEEQALLEYRLSDDSACGTGEASQRASEEALTRRYQDLERQALMQYLRSTSSNSEIQSNCEEDSSNERNQRGRSNDSSRSSSQLVPRLEDDGMVNLKVLQREKTQASPSKPNIQDNQPDKRVYRKHMLKKPKQTQQDLEVQHLHDNGNSNKFVQVTTPHLAQHQQVQHLLNNSDLGQRAHQQLLQEQLTLLHFNQQASQPIFEQLNPFHKLPQKITQKLPQPEFCLQSQQNYQSCQQLPPQPTLQPNQAFSQLHLIELQQRLSHPGLSPQQVVELQTLYQHQTFMTPELEFLQQHQKASKKQYPQKTTVPKLPFQKQIHRRQHSQPKLHLLENQEQIQHLEIQQQTVFNQNLPLMLSLPPIVASQSQLIEIQSRWQQMSSYSCPASPAPQCGGPLIDPRGDMALGGARPYEQLQARPEDVTSSLKVTDSAASLTNDPILTVEESSQRHRVTLDSTPLNPDPGTSTAVSTSQDPPPEPYKGSFRNERKLTKKSSKKKKKQTKSNGSKKDQNSKNCPKLKIPNGGEVKEENRLTAGSYRDKEEEGAKCLSAPTSVDHSKWDDNHEVPCFRSGPRLNHLRRTRSCECLPLDDRQNCDKILLMWTSNDSHLRADKKKCRPDKTNNKAKRRRTENESGNEMHQ